MSLKTIPICYATPSAGMHESHTFPVKLRAIAEAKFPYAELSFPELEVYAKQLFERRGEQYRELDENGEGDLDKLIETGKMVKLLCDELGIKILAVHPFAQFEGQKDPQKTKSGLLHAKALFKLLHALDCSMMQVGSNHEDNIEDSFDKMADDLRQLADAAIQEEPPIKMFVILRTTLPKLTHQVLLRCSAYEMWSWGTFVNTWRHTWDICQRVNRDNFGLCLDTFQICAREWADPMVLSGISSNAEGFRSSMDELSKNVNPVKIFYLQISDGARVNSNSLRTEAQKENIKPLYLWSNKFRPLPYSKPEWGGYLPVLDVIKAVLRTGWRGPWSYEVFFEQDQANDDQEIPRVWTKEAAACHNKLLTALRESDFT